MRLIFSALAVGALVACSPKVPDSASGIGFDNSSQAQQARDAALAGTPLAPPLAVSEETLAPAVDPILAAGASLDETAANSGVAPVQASPQNPAPVSLNNPGISDENSFEAVAARETIQSDAERIAANQAQYEVIAPTEVPDRVEGGQPNIVQYALRTSHPVGRKLHNRNGFNLRNRNLRNCATYASADQAQIDFLAMGGPQRDRKALDPDGDGYACDWNPAPFRSAVRN
ncbi:MAG: hypothetical protein NXH82_14970 [Rhodobacteraceae bacterium]|nr:hypothetical protein [Paracoccaceae bacterium]